MTAVQQIFCHAVAAVNVVYQYLGGVAFVVSVQKHVGDFYAVQYALHFAAVFFLHGLRRQRQHQTVHTATGQPLDVLDVVVHAFFAVAQNDVVAVIVEFRLQVAHRFGEELVGNVRYQHAHDVRLTRDKASRHVVGVVAHVLGNSSYTRSGTFGNVALVVEHQRYRSDRQSQLFGNVFDCYFLLHCIFLLGSADFFTLFHCHASVVKRTIGRNHTCGNNRRLQPCPTLFRCDRVLPAARPYA